MYPKAPSERSARAARGGVEFLLNAQGDDGMWRDFMTPAGEASSWTTGFVVSALRVAGADHRNLSRAERALVERQQLDGGWGYNEATPSDADSTSWVIRALLAGVREHGEARARAAAFLRRHQRRDGGFATYANAGPIRRYTSLPRWVPFRGWCKPTVEVSAAATRALSAIDPSAPHDSGWRYIQSKQRPDGSWGAYWWTAPHVATQQAVALGASLGHSETIRRAAMWAIRVFDAGASAFNSALCLSIVATATPSDFDTIERLTGTLQRGQLSDGSWPTVPILRIPVPADTSYSDHTGWQPIRFHGGLEIADQHRTFTTATCVTALVEACNALAGAPVTTPGL